MKSWYDITDNNKEYQPGTFPVGNGNVSHTLVTEIPITYELVNGLTFSQTIQNFFTNPSNDFFEKLEYVIFTDKKMPEKVGDLNLDPNVMTRKIEGLDKDNDGGIVAWVDRNYVHNLNTRRPAVAEGETALFISTQTPGQKVIANINCSSMFYGNCFYNVKLMDVNKLDVSNVMNMEKMFSSVGQDATTFKADLDTWNVSKVTNMSGMFANTGYNSQDFNLYIGQWNTTNVERSDSMFMNCANRALEFHLNLSLWDFKNNRDLSNMFYGIGALEIRTPLNIANFAKITNITSRAYCDHTDGDKYYDAGTFPTGNGNVSHWLTK